MPAQGDPITTVKVPLSLRQRIARHAAASGQTAAAFLSDAVDRWERDQRIASVRAVYAGSRDADYIAEIDAWESTTADGSAGV